MPNLISHVELAAYPGLSLRKRVVGSEIVVDVLFRDPRTAKQGSRRAGTTREQLIACLEDTMHSMSTSPIAPTVASDSKTPFGIVAREWFAVAATGVRISGRKYEPGTLTYKCDFYTAHIKGALAVRPIGSIKPVHLAQLLARLDDEGVGAPARQKVRAILRNIFSWAKSKGYILFDPAEHLATVPHSQPDTTDDFFTVDEVRRLIDPAVYQSLSAKKVVRHAEHYRVFFLLLLWAGLRIGELAGLVWVRIPSLRPPRRLVHPSKGIA